MFLAFPILLGLLILVVVAGTRGDGPDTPPTDRPGASTRRLILHTALFAAWLMMANGLIMLAREVDDALAQAVVRQGAGDLAAALALLIVGGPLTLGLLRVVVGNLRHTDFEARSFVWMLYLNVTLTVGLWWGALGAHQLLAHLIGSFRGEGELSVSDFVSVVVWVGLWGVHWFWLRRRYQPAKDVDLLIGSTIGLGFLSFGMYGALHGALDGSYLRLFRPVLNTVAAPLNLDWVPTLVVGIVVWGWYWYQSFRRRRRSSEWQTYVVLFASLPGFAVGLVVAATMIYTVLQWVFGLADTPGATHFRHFPSRSATLLTALTVWQYHRTVLHENAITSRNQALRTYDYVIIAASLTATTVGLTMVLSTFFQVTSGQSFVDDNTSLGDVLLAAATTVGVSAPLWWRYWSRLNARLRLDGIDDQLALAELSAPLRRIFFFGVFGVAGAAAAIAGTVALYQLLLDLLEGNLGPSTLFDLAVPVPIAIVAGGVLWFHAVLFRDERHQIEALADLSAPSAPGAPVTKDGDGTWLQRARLATPGGVHSNARLECAETVFVRGEGPWLFDADGARHIDYMLGRGPAVFGHSPTFVNEAVAKAATQGLTLGQATPFEVQAAEAALSVIPWADQIRFTSSGSEAVQAALRLARAATGRRLVVQFEGHYHGWFDNVSLRTGASPRDAVAATQGQVPESGMSTVLLPWNAPDAVTNTFERWGDQIAAVITEPVNVFGARMAAPGYLEQLRTLTTDHGALLIFDEVVTGFRLQPGSAASLVGVTPDLGTYAKGLGSGWPVSAVAGQRSLFEAVETDTVRLSGTYNGSVPAMAAVQATVAATKDGELHRRLNEWGDQLRAGLVSVAASHQINLATEGFGAAFWPVFPDLPEIESRRLAERLSEILRPERVVLYHHTWLSSTAHDDEALRLTIDAVERVIPQLQ